jgi:threonine dehydratase
METTDENVSVELDLWASRVEDAHRRIQPMVLRTETRAGMGVVPDFQGKLTFKLEHRQTTGSFKLRGAASRITALTRREAEAGVVTSSMGNHGVAVAWAGLEAGVPVEVFVSTHVTADRVARMEALEARVHLVGDSVLEAEMAARAAAESGDRVYVSPYNDPWVVAGQGTIGLELLEDLPDLDAVFVAVGGGGLVGGVGAWLRARAPHVEVVGCWPEHAPALHECLSAGRIIDVPERRTLSESTAGGIEEGSITFELARRVVDHRVLVSEEEILDAMRRLHASEGSEVEGAAGVALAAFLKERSSYQGRHVAVVLCGANLSPWVRARLADR